MSISSESNVSQSNVEVIYDPPNLCAGYTTEIAATGDKLIAVVDRPCFRIAMPTTVAICTPDSDFDAYVCDKHNPMLADVPDWYSE